MDDPAYKIESPDGHGHPLWTLRVRPDGTFSGRFDRQALAHPWAYDRETQEKHRRGVSDMGAHLSGYYHQVIQAANVRHMYRDK